MIVKVKKMKPEAELPVYAHPGDAGLDLWAAEEVVAEPKAKVQVPTGIAFCLPDGYVGLIWDKSGLSHKYGLKTVGGVIDASYRGEVKVGIVNLSDQPFTFRIGDKVAQILIQPVVRAELEEVSHLEETKRGEDGFGSTGR